MNRTSIKLPLLLLLGFTFGCAGESDAGHDADHAADKESHDEEEHVVELTPEQVKNAGIEVMTAGPANFDTLLRLSAVVAENLDAQAHVNPRVPGLVQSVHASLGQVVQAGDLLCVIDSVAFGRSVSDYFKAEALLESSRLTFLREQEMLDRAVTLADTVYQREKDLSEREITTLRSTFEADRALREAQLRRDSRILELENRIVVNTIEFAATRTRLLILGLAAEDLQDLESIAEEKAGGYRIRAPRDGVIVARHITEGEFVDAETRLFEIQDLTTVWVLAAVYEQNIQELRTGVPVQVDLDAFPDVTFDGVVDFIDFHLDPATRAASVRVLLENKSILAWDEDFPVRPGMFGAVEVATSTRKAAVVIPEAAVVHEGEHDFVFVRIAPGHFEQREVEVSAETKGMVEVLDGLEAGEEVVVTGTFELKSSARKGDLGGGHEH